MRIFFCLALLMVVGSCASTHDSKTPEPVTAPSSRAAAPPRAILESDVFTVFSGNDASAMSALGQRLEAERPSLPVGLLDRMLTFLHEHVADDPGLRMLRPMLFRSVAVIIGTQARPTLQGCVASGGDLDHLCEDTLREVDAQN